jgi:hypothetical protein
LNPFHPNNPVVQVRQRQQQRLMSAETGAWKVMKQGPAPGDNCYFLIVLPLDNPGDPDFSCSCFFKFSIFKAVMVAYSFISQPFS